MLISEIRQALADAITANVVSTPPLIALGYVPDDIVPPCIYTDDIEVKFDQTHQRGLDRVDFVMRLLCSRADDRFGQKLLDAYLAGSGATSVKAALEAERGAPGELALGGLCDDFHVTGIQAYRWYVVRDVKFVGAEFRISVWGSGD